MQIPLLIKRKKNGAGETALQQPAKKKRRLKKKTKILLVVAVVAAVAAGILLYRLFFTQEKKVALTGTTTYGSMASSITGSGTTTPADSKTYTTASTSEIESVNVSRGDTVQAGDLLYVQDDSEVDDQLADYQSQMDDDEKSLTDAQDSLADQYETLAGLTSTAPFSGHLEQVTNEKGDTVKSGDVLAEVVDDSSMKLTEYVSYAYENQIYLGMSATISVPNLMLTLTGKVTNIEKVVRNTDEGTKCFSVTVTVANPGALTEGMSAGAYLLDGSTKIYPTIEGTLEYNQVKTLTASAGGELTYVGAVNYQAVTAGEKLFSIDDTDCQRQISNLKSQITADQEKITTLQKRIDEEEASRSDYTVYSDITGIVVEVDVKAGDTPAKGDTAVKVFDLSTIKITADIDEMDIKNVTEGMSVKLTSESDSSKTYTGTVSDVSLTATSSNGVATFPVTITIDGADNNISAGVYLDYYIQAGDATESVLAPVAAVQSTDQGDCLFVKTDTRPDNAIDLADGVVPDGFYAIPVTVGTSNGTKVQILSGAEKGMEVFTGYQQTAPSDGDTTSSNGESTTNSMPSGMPGGGMPGDMGSGGGNWSGNRSSSRSD